MHCSVLTYRATGVQVYVLRVSNDSVGWEAAVSEKEHRKDRQGLVSGLRNILEDEEHLFRW